MKEHELPHWKVKTPKGNIYSKHSTLSESFRHMAEVLQSRNIEPTVKNAMQQGFSVEKDK